MDDALKQKDDLERFRWRAHGVSEVILDQGLIFTRTRPEARLADIRAGLARWQRNPDSPSELPPRPALDYEPLKQTTLPNALARIALAADRHSEASHGRYRELRQRYLDQGKEPRTAEWLAKREVGRMTEGAAIREATRFYRQYGNLGFQELPRDSGQRWPEAGEPLGWVIAEATTVRFALELIDALNRDDLRDLKRVLASRERRESPAESGERFSDALPGRVVVYLLCRTADHCGASWNPEKEPWPDIENGWYEHVCHRLLSESDADLKDHAGQLVANLVRSHLPGQAYGFIWHEGHFLELPERGPLLRAIWLHVKDTATNRREIRHCRECGSPFLVTDRRQRFCPPDTAGGKSRCLARRQMRASRGPAKRPEDDGATS